MCGLASIVEIEILAQRHFIWLYLKDKWHQPIFVLLAGVLKLLKAFQTQTEAICWTFIVRP